MQLRDSLKARYHYEGVYRSVSNAESGPLFTAAMPPPYLRLLRIDMDIRPAGHDVKRQQWTA